MKEKGSEKRSVKKTSCPSWEVLMQCESSGEPEAALNISLIKMESFKSKYRRLSPKCKLVGQERGLIAKGLCHTF